MGSRLVTHRHVIREKLLAVGLREGNGILDVGALGV
jgi:hypothetical protein